MATVQAPAPQAIAAFAVWDTRLSAPRPSYAVNMGAGTISAVQKKATTESAPALIWEATIPSLDTFVDRRLIIAATMCFQFTAQSTVTVSGAGFPVVVMGRDLSFNAFPLQAMSANISLQTNTANVSFTTSQILQYVLRTQDTLAARRAAVGAVKMPVYASNTKKGQANASPFGTMDTMPNGQDPGNGAYPMRWVVPAGATPLLGGNFPAGTPLASIIGVWWVNGDANNFPGAGQTTLNSNGVAGGYVSTPAAGQGCYQVGSVKHYFVNGVVVTNDDVDSLVPTTYTLAAQFDFAETLLVSPFTSGEFAAERQPAITGVSTFQMNMQLQQPDAAGVLVAANPRMKIAGVGWGPSLTSSSSPVGNTALEFNYLTAPSSLYVPDTCTTPLVQWQAFPFPSAGSIPPASLANIAAQSGTTATWTAGVGTVSSSSFNLPQIPDMLVIGVRPANYADDFWPLDGTAANPAKNRSAIGNFLYAIQSINVTFAGQNGLLSNVSQRTLYDISRKNGLEEMSYLQWSGLSIGADDGSQNMVPTSGGPLILRFGTDIQMPETLAAGVQGAFAISLIVTVKNYTAIPATPVLDLVAVYSGYITSNKGASSTATAPLTQKNVLTAQNVAKASKNVAATTTSELARLTGGSMRLHVGAGDNASLMFRDLLDAAAAADAASKEKDDGVEGGRKRFRARGSSGYGRGLSGAAVAARERADARDARDAAREAAEAYFADADAAAEEEAAEGAGLLEDYYEGAGQYDDGAYDAYQGGGAGGPRYY